MIHLTAIGQPPVGSSTVHIYTQTIHRTTQNKQYVEQHKNTQNNTKKNTQNNTKIRKSAGRSPSFAGFTQEFAIQLRNYENNQQDALYRLIYYSKSALHVSGDVFAHHQKNLTVFTVPGSVHPSCCRLVPAAAWVNTTRYCKYSQVLLMMGETIARNMQI